MPHSTRYQCLDCETSIAGDERASEFVERQVVNSLDATRVDVLPQYTHEGHEGGARARGYAGTGRTDVLDKLRDSWKQPQA